MTSRPASSHSSASAAPDTSSSSPLAREVETVSTAARTPGSVTVDTYGVRRGDEQVRWADLRTIRLRGGEEADFVLQSREGRCVVPLRAAPDGFLDRLQGLPGFDNGALVSGLAWMAEADFVCWRAPR